MNQTSTSANQLPAEYVRNMAANTGATPTLLTWLDVLNAVFPAHGTLLVGAGAGTGPWVQWLKRNAMHSVWLIEGDEVQHQNLQNNLPKASDWNTVCTIVAHNTEPTSFYHANNPAENGLIQPDHLREFWPNLQTRQKKEIETPTTLDIIADEISSSINWLILDCLPAASFLRGGRRMLANLELVLLRTTIDQLQFIEPDAQLPAADELLSESGFKRIALQTDRNPALAHALYIRDTFNQITQLSQEKDNQACLASERKRHIDTLTKDKESLSVECDTLKQQQSDLLEQCESLKQRNKDLEFQLDESSQKQNALIEEMDRAEAQLELLKDLLLPDEKLNK